MPLNVGDGGVVLAMVLQLVALVSDMGAGIIEDGGAVVARMVCCDGVSVMVCVVSQAKEILTRSKSSQETATEGPCLLSHAKNSPGYAKSNV